MGIFDRLGNVINSYLNDFGEETAGRLKSGRRTYSDPDLDAAYEELNDYLNRKEYSWRNTETEKKPSAKERLPPEELRADFQCLGVPFGADAETCKAAYKKLLKIHHPDRHAGHEGNFKKATAKSAKINAAWDRIEKFHLNE
jgi:DnaJ-class molecular chaperone